MAEFIEVMKQRERICAFYDCEECPINSVNNGRDVTCEPFITKYPQKAEELILKWAEEHPFKTNADKFVEVFGFDFVEGANGCVGLSCDDFEGDCTECVNYKFWDREYKENR